MAKLTSRSKTKSIKKNNYRIFGLAISALMIIALVAMIPLTLMSLKNEKGTDGRSQAAVRASVAGDDSYLYFNTSARATYPQTRYESALISSLPANVDIRLSAELIPYNLKNNGVEISLVCLQATCPRPNGAGTVNRDQAIEKLQFAPNQVTLGTQAQRSKTLRFNSAVSNVGVRIFSDGGTESLIQYVRLTNANGTEYVQNSEFADKVNLTIRRSASTWVATNDTLKKWAYGMDEDNNFIVRNKQYAEFPLYYFMEGAPYNFSNHPYFLTHGFLINANSGSHNLVIESSLIKKRPNQDSKIRVYLVIVSSNVADTGRRIIETDINYNNLNQFQTHTLSFDTLNNANHHYAVFLRVPVGVEMKLKNVTVTGRTATNVKPFLPKQEYDAPTTQPRAWNAGTNNLNYAYGEWFEGNPRPM